MKKPGILAQQIRYPLESLNYLKVETAEAVSHVNISFPIVIEFQVYFWDNMQFDPEFIQNY